jgi:ABC-type transporter Mla maintaining outer membrane lipid asymmetry ATPase subunit MlaF
VQREFDVTSIVISHDMASTFRIAHRVAMLHKGHIVACGTPDEVRAAAESEVHVQEFIYAGATEAPPHASATE